MSPSSRRPLTIRDLLILITATAVGLVPFGGGWPQISSGHRELAWSQHEIVSRLSELFFPLVASYSVAMVIIRLRHPRPDLRTVAREPGAAACLAASFAVGLAAAWRLPFELVRGRFSGHYAFHDGMDRPAYAVLGAWLVLALALIHI